MSATYDAGMARLQEVLDAPVEGRTRHDHTAAAARQYAAEPPRGDITIKRLAAAEPAEDAELTGQFEALVSDFLPDRTMEAFVPGAFDNAIKKIRDSGKATPVLFGHNLQAVSAVLGMVPATGWRIDHEGLHASGWIDVSEPLGRKLYAMLKSGALQWSIGFRMGETRPGRAGVRELVEVDELVELSVTPVPANSRTRASRAKGLTDRQVPTTEELREQERALGLDPETLKVREDTRKIVADAIDHSIRHNNDKQHTETLRQNATASHANSHRSPSVNPMLTDGAREDTTMPATHRPPGGQRRALNKPPEMTTQQPRNPTGDR